MSRYHHALAKFADKFDLEFMRRLDISQANDELLDEIDSYYREKTRNKGYTTTEEYREIYPLVAAIGNEQRKRFKESGEKMMAEAGLSYGDKVFYDHVHAFGAEQYEGVIVRHKAQPKVKLTTGTTMQGKKTVNWHKGWKAISDAPGAAT